MSGFLIYESELDVVSGKWIKIETDCNYSNELLCFEDSRFCHYNPKLFQQHCSQLNDKVGKNQNWWKLSRILCIRAQYVVSRQF